MALTKEKEVTEVTFIEDGRITAYLDISILDDGVKDDEASSKKNGTFDDWDSLPQIAKDFVIARTT